MAGPPEYLEVRNEFYSDTQGILLVYDATNASSFESLPLWLDELRHYLPEDAVRTWFSGSVQLSDKTDITWD